MTAGPVKTVSKSGTCTPLFAMEGGGGGGGGEGGGGGVGGASTVRLATYNVLNPALVSPTRQVQCEPRFLDASYRLAQVLRKLGPEIEAGAVIGLQELCLEWSSALHVLFAAHDYHFLTAHFDSKVMGHMGVGLAFCRRRFALEAASTVCVADLKPGPPEGARDGDAVVSSLDPAGNDGTWELVRKQPHQLIAVRLRPRTGAGGSFAVAVYHMPCLYKSPNAMAVHATLAAQHVTAFAGGRPFVLMGDFNIVPGERKDLTAPVYKLLTGAPAAAAAAAVTGVLAPPPEFEGDAWVARVDPPLRSAYAVAQGGAEPEVTNVNAKAPERGGLFANTLDYIFVSQGGWRVVGVLPLPRLADLPRFRGTADVQALPHEGEPSDHLMLAATLALLLPDEEEEEEEEDAEEAEAAKNNALPAAAM